MKIKTIFTVLLFWFPVLLYGAIKPSQEGIIFVNPYGGNDADGSTWDQAITLQEALEFINEESNPDVNYQIWMQEGEYFIHERAFRIRKNVTMYGGFSGIESSTESRPSDGSAAKTILKSEAGEDRILIIANSSSNRIKVYIDGVTITGGKAHKTVENYPLDPTSAYRGGGIFIGNAEVNFKNVSVTGNQANTQNAEQTSRGGGIYSTDSELTFVDCTISSNTAKSVSGTDGSGFSGTGGGLYCYNSTAIITNTSIHDNIATEGNANGYGGGIYSYNSTLELIKTAIYNNTAQEGNASGYGGGIYHKSGGFTLTNCRITNNTAITGDDGEGYGGGIYAEGGATLFEIRETDIMDNYAISSSNSDKTAKGGGIYSHNRPFSIINSNISGNYATAGSGEGWGGGLQIKSDNREFNIVNTLFHHNVGGSKGGGIHVESGTNIILTNLTMTHNGEENSGEGGGMYIKSGAHAILFNCILWNNLNDDLQCEEQSVTERYSSLVRGYKNSDIDSDELNGITHKMIEDYPQFADPENQNYRLGFNSPARLLGDPSANEKDSDLDGNPRKTANEIDLGAYQYTPYLVTLSSPIGFNYILPDINNYNLISPTEYEIGSGQFFRFEITTLSGYGGTAEVKANGVIIYPQNGIYSVEVKTDINITVSGFYALPNPTPLYPVTIEMIGEGELKVIYGFNFEVKDGYLMEEGSLLRIIATPEEDYVLQSIQVNNMGIENGSSYRITGTTHIYVLFAMKDPDPNPDPTGNLNMEKESKVWSTAGNLHIKTSQPVNLRVISITGKVVINQSFGTGESTIPLPKGIYIYVLGNNKPGKIIIRD